MFDFVLTTNIMLSSCPQMSTSEFCNTMKCSITLPLEPMKNYVGISLQTYSMRYDGIHLPNSRVSRGGRRLCKIVTRESSRSRVNSCKKFRALPSWPNAIVFEFFFRFSSLAPRWTSWSVLRKFRYHGSVGLISTSAFTCREERKP